VCVRVCMYVYVCMYVENILLDDDEQVCRLLSVCVYVCMCVFVR
jgi:hypothetical protein